MWFRVEFPYSFRTGKFHGREQQHNLKSKTGRAALEERREPYWSRIEAGLFLGYRVASRGGEGTWIARRRNEQGKQEYRALRASMITTGRRPKPSVGA